MTRTSVHSIDEIEKKYRAVQPFVRLFALYSQFAAAVALLAIPVGVAFLPTDARVSLGAVIVVIFALIATAVAIAFSAAIGMLNAVAATVLFALLATHAFFSLPFLISGLYIAAAVLGVIFETFSWIGLLVAIYEVSAVLFLLYLYWRGVIAIVSMYRMRDEDRTAMRRLGGRFLLRALKLPPNLEFYAPRRVISIAVLALIASVLMGWAAILFAVLPVGLSQTAASLIQQRCVAGATGQQGAYCFGFALGPPFMAFVVVPAVFLCGSLVQRFGRSLSILPLEGLQQVDVRPPILFLRAFKDDQIPLRPEKLALLGWLLEYGNRKNNLDHMLLEEGSPYGPVVAIGSPNDRFPPYGAARGYFNNKTWQQAVAGLAQESAAIVVCVDATEGLWWEIEHLVANDLLVKVLFVVHPRYAGETANTELASKLVRALGYDPSTLDLGVGSLLGVFRDTQGTLHIARSQTFSQAAYVFALRLFLRGKLGTEPIRLKWVQIDDKLMVVTTAASAPTPDKIRADQPRAAAVTVAQTVRAKVPWRDVESLFQTERGILVSLRDARILAPIDGAYRVFATAPEYRRLFDDDGNWQELQNGARDNFLRANSTLFDEGASDQDITIASAPKVNPSVVGARALHPRLKLIAGIVASVVVLSYGILLLFHIEINFYLNTWLASSTSTPISENPVPAYSASNKIAVSALSRERELALKPADAFKECAACPEMIVVPGGSFNMGAGLWNQDPRQGPQHKVIIAKPLAVAKFELTFDEWDACLAAGGCNDYSPSDEGWGRGRRPAIRMSWYDAKAYVAWLAAVSGKPYRLLTEAEYEYATRAGTQTRYPWGDDIGTNNANCLLCGTKWDRTAPVGSFPPNTFGLFDMVGNVFEWVEDCWHDKYGDFFSWAPIDGSAWISGDCSLRVVRGGSWQNVDSASRQDETARSRGITVGFRVARTLVAP